jgi:hypothetical protein
MVQEAFTIRPTRRAAMLVSVSETMSKSIPKELCEALFDEWIIFLHTLSQTRQTHRMTMRCGMRLSRAWTMWTWEYLHA